MTAEEVIKKYPKSIENLRKRIPPEQLPPGATPEMMIAMMLEVAPRQLFDFFDEHKIYLVVRNDSQDSWWYDVVHEEQFIKEESNFKKRSDAEKAGYLSAFDVLESKLK